MARHLRTPERLSAICEAVARGLSPSRAAIVCGVSKQALSDWCDPNGLNFDQDIPDSIARAESAFIQARLASVQAAEPKDWRAAAWLLERRYPAEFGEQRRESLRDQVREEAEKLAQERGIPVEDVLAEVDRMFKRKRGDRDA